MSTRFSPGFSVRNESVTGGPHGPPESVLELPPVVLPFLYVNNPWEGRLMKTKITTAVIALMLLPSMSMAYCSGHKEITASSCKEGSSWDQGKGECIPTPTT